MIVAVRGLMRRALGPLLLGLLLLPLHAAGSQEVATIHVAGPPIDDYKPVYYAIQSGLFKKYGLNVDATITSSGSAALAAVAGGSMQVAFTSLPAVLQAHVRGVPFKVVAPAQWYLADAPTAMMIVKKDGSIRSGRDLDGKTIATSSLKDLNQTASLAWIDANGGDSKTVKMVELPSSAIATAIDEGRIDAATIADPFLSAAVNSGKARVLAHSYDAIGKRFETSVYVSMDDFVQGHQDAMKRFAAAMHESIVYTNTHLPETVTLVASYSGVEPAVVAKTIRVIDPEYIDPRNLQPMIDIGVKYGLIERAFDANDLIASTALRAPR
jgi:NitT/TauT family transport system substrate-binding protein